MPETTSEKEILDEIKIVKQLLMAQLVLSSVFIRDITKITGMNNRRI